MLIEFVGESVYENKQMRESIELDPGRENNKVAVMAKLGHLEVERQTIKDQLHLAKEELTSPNLSKLGWPFLPCC